jgi:RHS repeat-associated protein
MMGRRLFAVVLLGSMVVSLAAAEEEKRPARVAPEQVLLTLPSDNEAVEFCTALGEVKAKSGILITDDNGHRISEHDYFPFGVEATPLRQETLPVNGFNREEPMKFTGHERDFNIGTSSENSNYLDYMHARYYSPTVGRFLSVDPALDVKSAITSPQEWNRYSYVENNPITKNDPTGKCSDPGGTGTRICIGAFIPQSTFGGFKGDGRGAMPNAGTSRVEQRLTLTPGGHGATKEDLKPGTSKIGPFARDANIAQHDMNTSKEGVTVQTKASDGLLFGAAPNLSYNLTLTPTANGGTEVTGSHSAFPSLEVWKYSDGQQPQLIYHYDATAKSTMDGVHDIQETVKIPEKDKKD